MHPSKYEVFLLAKISLRILMNSLNFQGLTSNTIDSLCDLLLIQHIKVVDKIRDENLTKGSDQLLYDDLDGKLSNCK
jgi:hypothetical protein